MGETRRLVYSGGSEVSYSDFARRSAGSFKISLNYDEADQDLIDRWRTEIGNALSRWSAVIVGTALARDVTLRIDFTAPASIDGGQGILAQGSWGALDSHGMPASGRMKVDRSDIGLMEQWQIVSSVLAHEMGHAIGLGKRLWEARGLYHDDAGGPAYSGANAMAVYGEWIGAAPTRVPLEDTGGAGTRGQHWRSSTFGNREVMVGMISSGPRLFSRLTLAGLVDIGYAVDWAAADAFAPGERSFDHAREPAFLCLHSDAEDGGNGIVVPEGLGEAPQS